MASDMQSCSITQRLREILIKHGDVITPCLISMLLYGVEHLEVLEPCCDCCVEYGEIAKNSDVWCTDIAVIVDVLA